MKVSDFLAKLRIFARRPYDSWPFLSYARSYLLSTVLSPERFNQVVRSHGDIENGRHGVLDVVMNEDQARHRNDHGPENLAVPRRLALNLARLEAGKGSLRAKFKRAGWDDAFLTRLLAQIAPAQMQ